MKWMLGISLLMLSMSTAKAQPTVTPGGGFQQQERDYVGERHQGYDRRYQGNRYHGDHPYWRPRRHCPYIAGVRVCQ